MAPPGCSGGYRSAERSASAHVLYQPTAARRLILRAFEEEPRDRGHGGMDYIEEYRLIQCLRGGGPMDMDV